MKNHVVTALFALITHLLVSSHLALIAAFPQAEESSGTCSPNGVVQTYTSTAMYPNGLSALTHGGFQKTLSSWLQPSLCPHGSVSQGVKFTQVMPYHVYNGQ